MRKHKIISTAICIIAVFACALAVYAICEGRRVVNTSYTFESDRVPEQFDGFKIALITDFHNCNNYAEVAEKVYNTSPDIICIAGDLVSMNTSDYSNTKNLIGRLMNIAQVYYSYGNHEYYNATYHECDEPPVKEGAGMRSRILQSQYPIKYSDLVEKYAAEYKLDKSLVYAVIRTESKFDQYAVSVTNARGLMQVQSETGGDCAAELKIKDYSSDMLFEPDINIRIGCYYLSKLMKLYNNDVKKSVAAYNAGLGNVDKWLKNSEYADGKGGLKDIPFPETKNYVDGVVKAQKIYKELYFTAE